MYPLSAAPLKCVSKINQECQVSINVNSNEPIFYRYIVEINKCSGSFNNISDPYAKLCVPNIVKDIQVKLLNLMSRTNEKDIQNDMKPVNINVD